MNRQRVEAFSDGVFAIAATLLVLELRDPNVGSDLFAALVRGWPAYAAYATSFLTILIIWINHHDLMARAQRIDPALLLLNGLLLLTVAVLPFPTGLFAHYLEAGHDANVAGAVYGLSATLMAITYTAVLVYVEKGRRRAGWSSLVATSIGLGVYPLAAVVALVQPAVALAIYAGTAIFYAILPVVRRAAPEPI